MDNLNATSEPAVAESPKGEDGQAVLNQTDAIKKTSAEKKHFSNSFLFPFVIWILYSGIFAGLYSFWGEQALTQSKDIINPKVLLIFKQYGIYAGAIAGFLSTILLLILYSIKKIIRLGKVSAFNPFLLALAYSPWAAFGWQLLFREKRYTDIARGLITFSGAPLYYSSLIIISLSALWLVLVMIKMFVNIFKK